MSKKVRYLKITTDNEHEYFSKASGGSNRQWVKRYDEMIRKLRNFENSPNYTGKKKFIEGYKSCLDTFHSRDNILSKDKDE